MAWSDQTLGFGRRGCSRFDGGFDNGHEQTRQLDGKRLSKYMLT